MLQFRTQAGQVGTDILLSTANVVFHGPLFIALQTFNQGGGVTRWRLRYRVGHSRWVVFDTATDTSWTVSHMYVRTMNASGPPTVSMGFQFLRSLAGSTMPQGA